MPKYKFIQDIHEYNEYIVEEETEEKAFELAFNGDTEPVYSEIISEDIETECLEGCSEEDDDTTLSARIYVPEEYIGEAEAALETFDGDWDLDIGNRIMVATGDIQEVIDILSDAGIDAEVV